MNKTQKCTISKILYFDPFFQCTVVQRNLKHLKNILKHNYIEIELKT